MEFVFCADVHLTEYRNDRYVQYGNVKLPKKTVAIIECLYELAKYTRENLENKFVIISGDLVDKHSVEYASTIELLEEYFTVNSDIDFLLVTGNHDISDKGENPFNWLRRFETLPNVTIVDYNKYMKLSDRILVVSYSANIVNLLKEAIESYPECDILISHFGVHEAQLTKLIKGVGNVSFRDLASKFKLILLGDYHIPQELDMYGSKLIYVGSVIQKTWNEYDEEKRFLHVKISKDNYDIKSIPFTKYPKHIYIKVTKLDELDKAKEEYKRLRKDNYVKIMFELEDDISTREKNKIKNKIREFGLRENIIVTEKVKSNDNIECIDLSLKNKDKLIKYLEIKGIENTDKYIKSIEDLI